MSSKAITNQQFLSQASSLKMQPSYLIIGEDDYLTDKVFQTIREIVKRSMKSFESLALYGDELTVGELSEYLDSYSLFAENRLLQIRNAERLGEEDKNRKNADRQKKMLELINNYLSSPEPSQVLVLIADSVDSRQAGWKQIKESSVTIECEPVKHVGAMRAWLDSMLKEQKKTMTTVAKELFLNKVELDFCTAQNELEKLFIFVGDRKNITDEDVKTTLPTTRVGTMSDFYRSLGNRNTKDVLDRVLMMLETDWVDLQILSMIYRFYLTIWKIHALRAKHISNQEISTKYLKDVYESLRNDYLAFATKIKPEDMPVIFETILDTDYKIKSSNTDSAVLLTMCVVKICTGK